MMPDLSPNTKAILLLTAPLITGPAPAKFKTLTPSEYKKLVRLLRENGLQPSDLISADSLEAIEACASVVETTRLQQLLDRGFLLSQAVEHWNARAIWVISRADAAYPKRVKNRLRENAPAVLYGCGEIEVLETGGLAVVGSRNVDQDLIDYTLSVGQLAAKANKTLVSGGARGIDQASMRGALESGGKVCGVMADSLEKTVMNRDHRNMLVHGQLTLVSPYDPSAGFNVGNAMQRNKLIYALSDAALVVSSDLNKGGTWTGAVEQLDKLKLVPVYIRSTGSDSEGLNGLKRKGALPWPNPRNTDEFSAMLEASLTATSDIQPGLFAPQIHDGTKESSGNLASKELSGDVQINAAPPKVTILDDHPRAENLDPADELFNAVRTFILDLLNSPMNEAALSEALKVSKPQIRLWLNRLVEEGSVVKNTRPVSYQLAQQDLLKA